jgi:predicted nucleic acid-binding protein
VWALIDTSVYVSHWERGLDAAVLDEVGRAFVVRYSAVVLSELRRGARTRAAERMVARLHEHARVVWTPTSEHWWEAGRVVRTIGDAHHWDVKKRREFQNDALIALTARRHGATVVTANQGDFALLSGLLRFGVLFV